MSDFQHGTGHNRIRLQKCAFSGSAEIAGEKEDGVSAGHPTAQRAVVQIIECAVVRAEQLDLCFAERENFVAERGMQRDALARGYVDGEKFDPSTKLESRATPGSVPALQEVG